METFFDILFLCLLSYSIYLNTVMFKKVKSIDIENEYFKRKFVLNTDALMSESDQIHRSLLALRETLETAKPIKPNNWDSVREAFKGPVRIEINERD